jgi:hypothetical protein
MAWMVTGDARVLGFIITGGSFFFMEIGGLAPVVAGAWSAVTVIEAEVRWDPWALTKKTWRGPGSAVAATVIATASLFDSVVGGAAVIPGPKLTPVTRSSPDPVKVRE